MISLLAWHCVAVSSDLTLQDPCPNFFKDYSQDPGFESRYKETSWDGWIMDGTTGKINYAQCKNMSRAKSHGRVVDSRRQSSSIRSVKRRGRSGTCTGMSRLGLAFLAGFAGAGQVRQRQVWDGLEGLEGLDGLIMFWSEKCHERRELCLASSMLGIVCSVRSPWLRLLALYKILQRIGGLDKIMTEQVQVCDTVCVF